MSSYHTKALADADIFTVMGSIYAEVARYDSALSAGEVEAAHQAIGRAEELVRAANGFKKLNDAQKKEIKQFSQVLAARTRASIKSGLGDYLMPFALAARMHR